jgi:hypothetical protein
VYKANETVTMYRYLRTTMITQNFIQEEMRSRLHWRQLATIQCRILHFPVSHLLSRIMKIKNKSISNYDFTCFVVWVWSISKGEAWIGRLRTAQKIRAFGRKREEVTFMWRHFTVKNLRTEWGWLSRHSDCQGGGRPGFGFRQCTMFLFSTASRRTLVPTQVPVQWVPGAIPLGVKRQGREAERSSQRVPGSRKVEL